MRAAQQGSQEAIAELFARHWTPAYRAAYLVCGDGAAAEDIAQEAFLAALRALPRFDTRRPLRPWLHRIVVNRAIDFARARALRQEVGAEAAGRAGGARRGAAPRARRRRRRRAAGAEPRAARGRGAALPARVHARRDRRHPRPAARHGQLTAAARPRRPRRHDARARRDERARAARGAARRGAPRRGRGTPAGVAGRAGGGGRARAAAAGARAAGSPCWPSSPRSCRSPPPAAPRRARPTARSATGCATCSASASATRSRRSCGSRAAAGCSCRAATAPGSSSADGAKRRLGDYAGAAWSPNGLFVVAWQGRELTALTPGGEVRWSLPGPEPRRAGPLVAGRRLSHRLSRRAGAACRQRRRDRRPATRGCGAARRRARLATRRRACARLRRRARPRQRRRRGLARAPVAQRAAGGSGEAGVVAGRAQPAGRDAARARRVRPGRPADVLAPGVHRIGPAGRRVVAARIARRDRAPFRGGRPQRGAVARSRPWAAAGARCSAGRDASPPLRGRRAANGC